MRDDDVFDAGVIGDADADHVATGAQHGRSRLHFAAVLDERSHLLRPAGPHVEREPFAGDHLGHRRALVAEPDEPDPPDACSIRSDGAGHRSVEVVEPGGVVVEDLAQVARVEARQVIPQIVVGALGAAGRTGRHARRMREVGLVEDVVGAELLDGRQR